MNSNDAKAQAADTLFAAMTENCPAPWALKFHHVNRSPRPVRAIIDAEGDEVIYLETFTGDGDHFYLGDDGAEAMVQFVNAMNSAK